MSGGSARISAAHKRGLAAARLAGDTDDLAGRYLRVDIGRRLDRRASGPNSTERFSVEIRLDGIGRSQNWLRGSKCSLSHSPMVLKVNTAMTMVRPGSVVIHQA